MAVSVDGSSDSIVIDGKEMNLVDAMYFVQTALIAHQQDSIRDFINKVNDANNKLQAANAAAKVLEDMINQFNGSTDKSEPYSKVDGSGNYAQELTAALKAAGYGDLGKDPNLGQLMSLSDQISNDKTAANNTTQLDMQSLQNSVSQMQTSFAALSSFVKAFYDAIQQIIAKFT